MELIMATLAVSYAGYDFLSQAPHTRMEIANRDKAAAETILVKNHISLWTTTSMNRQWMQLTPK
jgi:hypothetical protein